MTRPGASCIWGRAIGSMIKAYVPALAAVLLVATTGHADDDSAEQLLGGGVAITLPKDMKLKQNPNMFKMKGVEQWDYRLRSSKLSMALTGIGFELPKGKTPDKLDTLGIINKGAAQYLPQATATAIEPIAFENGRLSGHHATLQAKEGQSFVIGFDAPRRCVTTAIIGAGIYKGMTVSYTVTIGSDDCDSKAHAAAVVGVAGMRPVE